MTISNERARLAPEKADTLTALPAHYISKARSEVYMSQEKPFYVYVHRYASGPKEGQVFYVGKGSGDRVKIKRGRNPHWGNVVKKYGYTYEVLMSFEIEDCAFSIERALILFYGRKNLTNKTDGGEGSSGIEFSNEELRKRKGRISGIKHPCYDRSKYKFTHETGEHFCGTSYEFHKKYKFTNSEVRKLVRDKFRTYKGWSIEGRRKKVIGRSLHRHHFWGVFGPNNPTCKKDILYFKHEDGESFVGTQSEFYTKYNLNKTCVSALINGRQKTHKGWRYFNDPST